MASSIKDGDLALQILKDTANEGSPYGFAIFDADNQELLDMFNAGLKDIKDSGEYNKIIAKYLGEDAVHLKKQRLMQQKPLLLMKKLLNNFKTQF